jgi:plasmid replication initiation protein
MIIEWKQYLVSQYTIYNKWKNAGGIRSFQGIDLQYMSVIAATYWEPVDFTLIS